MLCLDIIKAVCLKKTEDYNLKQSEYLVYIMNYAKFFI